MSDDTQTQQNELSDPKTSMQYLRLYFSGFAMGAADIVPGVSGGTMAFILGIYETLINAIKSVDVDVIKMALRFDVKGVVDHIPFRFLIALGLGILSAGFLLANVLHNLLLEQPTFIFSFFAGLIIASIFAIGLKVKWDVVAIAALVITAGVAFFIVGFNVDDKDPVGDYIHAVETGEAVDSAQIELIKALNESGSDGRLMLIERIENGDDILLFEDDLEAALYKKSDFPTLFFSGMIAICAMILPGISGSFLLLILGQYQVILGAVKNLDIVSISVFFAGAAIGIMLFSRLISWLLKHYENATIAGLVGFMVGSMRLIYREAADGVSIVNKSGSLDGGQMVLAIGLLVFGFLIVSLLDHMQSGENPVFAGFWKPSHTMK